MKKLYFLFYLLFFLNFSVIANAADTCVPISGITVGNPLLDEGVIDFESGVFDPVTSACVEYDTFDRDYFDIKGFAVNPNLGFLSFYSNINNQTGSFENLGVQMQTKLKYKVSLFPEFDQNNQIKNADFKGYAYSSGHGWLKFGCEKHPDLEFDEDVCDLFENQNQFRDECGNGFGVCIDFDNYDFRTKTFGLKGHAFSENLGFIDFKGARVEFPMMNMNYEPVVVDFGSSMTPISNGGKFYSLALKFILDGEDRTKEFAESNIDFCLRFTNGRKLSNEDSTEIVQAENCDDHTKLYGSDLNNYDKDAFVYDADSNIFFLRNDRKIASLVPSKADDFKINAVKTTVLGKETFYPLDLSLEFEMPMDLITLPYHIDSYAQCDFNNKLKVLKFNENFNNPFSLCSKFIASENLGEFEVEHIFESNVDDEDLGIDVFELNLDEEGQDQELFLNNWSFDGNNFVSNIFFRFNSTFVIPKELADNKLLFKGSYEFEEDGENLEVSRVISSVLDDSKSNYTPLIKGVLNDNFFKTMNDGVTVKNVQNNSLSYHQAFINKYRNKFRDSNCDLELRCVDKFKDGQDIVYLKDIPEGLNSQRLQGYYGDLLVLDGVNLIIDQNIQDDNFVGVVSSNANVYLKTSVTDLNLMLSTDGYLMSYKDQENLDFLLEEEYADYHDSLDESLFNQLYFKGELRAKNCFGCSLSNPIVLPNGKVAQDILDSYKARVWDLALLRRSPLQYNVREMFGELFYNGCDGQEFRIMVVFDDLNTGFLCYQSSINGFNLSKSQRIQDLNLGSKERALLFEYFDFGLPFFSQ